MKDSDRDKDLYEPAVYSIGDPALAKDLFAALTAIVNEKYKLDDYVSKSKLFSDAFLKSQQSNVPFDVSQQKERAEKQKEYASLKDASEHLLKEFTKLLEKNHPLGLLIFNSLKKGFAQPEMEDLFGSTIDNLRKDIESLGKEIDPQVSIVEQLLPFKQSDDTRRDILNFNIPEGGIEKFVLEMSLTNYQDSKFFPLMMEENLNQLIDKEIIQTDSFENVVGFHYLSALTKRLGEIEKAEKQVEEFWKTIGKISSALSLAALYTPATAPISPLIRGGAAIADLALLVHTINSVTANLKKYNEIMQKKLVNQDDFTTEIYARLGEVISLRKEFYKNLTEQLAIEIANIFIGGNWNLFKVVLFARSYLYDIETLAGMDDDSEDNQ